MSDTIKNNFKKIKAEQMRIREEVREKNNRLYCCGVGSGCGFGVE